VPNTCMTSQGHVDKMAACIAKHANGRQIITSCYRRLVPEAASLLFLANKIENIDPPKVALFVGNPGPHIKQVSLRPLSLQPERLFDRSVQPFKHSSLVTDRQTDRQTRCSDNDSRHYTRMLRRAMRLNNVPVPVL